MDRDNLVVAIQSVFPDANLAKLDDLISEKKTEMARLRTDVGPENQMVLAVAAELENLTAQQTQRIGGLLKSAEARLTVMEKMIIASEREKELLQLRSIPTRVMSPTPSIPEFHEVQVGDTLTSIVRKYAAIQNSGITGQRLQELNPQLISKTDPERLRVGDRIRLPALARGEDGATPTYGTAAAPSPTTSNMTPMKPRTPPRPGARGQQSGPAQQT